MRAQQYFWSGSVPNKSIVSVEQRYGAASLRAAIAVMLGWHVASALPTAVGGWSHYRPIGTGAWVWMAYALLGIVLATVVSRGGGQTAMLGLLITPLLLAGVV